MKRHSGRQPSKKKMRIRIGRDRRFDNISRRDVSDFNRLLQLFVSLQILFGSRRGVSFLLPLLLIAGLAFGGWMLFKGLKGPERMLESAHAQWDSGVTTEKLDAIKNYKKLIQMENPIEPGMRWLQTDRDILYRRIIEYELLFEKNESSTRDWIIRAYDEGFRDLRLPEGEVMDFWNKTLESLSGRSKKTPAEKKSKGKFGSNLRLEQGLLTRHGRDFQFSQWTPYQSG